MGSSFAIFIAYKFIGPGLGKFHRVVLPLYTSQNIVSLPFGCFNAMPFQIRKAVECMLPRKAKDILLHRLLQLRAARDSYAQADCSFRVKPFEVFEITIEERILVIPFNF